MTTKINISGSEFMERPDVRLLPLMCGCGRRLELPLEFIERKCASLVDEALLEINEQLLEVAVEIKALLSDEIREDQIESELLRRLRVFRIPSESNVEWVWTAGWCEYSSDEFEPHCSECGNALEECDKYCRNCGYKLVWPEDVQLAKRADAGKFKVMLDIGHL